MFDDIKQEVCTEPSRSSQARDSISEFAARLETQRANISNKIQTFWKGWTGSVDGKKSEYKTGCSSRRKAQAFVARRGSISFPKPAFFVLLFGSRCGEFIHKILKTSMLPKLRSAILKPILSGYEVVKEICCCINYDDISSF